jgi:hypothetical protein
VHSIGGNYDIRLGDLAIRKFQLRSVRILFEPDAAMVRAYRSWRKSFREHGQQIGPVHSIYVIPAAGIGGENWTYNRSVHPVVFRASTDPCADLRQRFAESHAFELSQTVWIYENAGPYLAQRRRLFEDRDVNTAPKQSIGCREPANSSSNDSDWKRLC